MHENLIRGEILSAERLEIFAENLALEHSLVYHGRKSGPMAKRLDENAETLRKSYLAVSDALRHFIEMPPAAEWLVDNYFMLDEQIREIQNDLPLNYYRRLPKLAHGVWRGYPRMYAIAAAFIAHTDSFFNPALLEKFIVAYQKRQALDIGELWAIPVNLRLALVENLRRAAALVIGDREARERADAFAAELLELVERDPKAVDKGMRIINRAPLTSSFVVQVIRRLRDQDARVIPFLQRLDDRLQKEGQASENVVRLEHQMQGALTVTVRNIITSMRLITTFDWVEFFEKVSLADQALRAESAFGRMDLPTRNLYRRAIETLARRSGITELNVTRQVLHFCQASRDTLRGSPDQLELRKCDPGYYLIDNGRPALEAAIGYRPSFGDRVRRANPYESFVLYILANVLLVTIIVDVGLRGALSERHPFGLLILLSVAAFFPAWEASITLVNRLVFLVRAPSILPGMAMREGVPEEFRAMVVMPVLLGSDEEIAVHANQLLVHYLGNPDEDLRFALLADFRDADAETLPGDEKLLNHARDRMAALNRQYPRADGMPRFYVLMRRRQWNPAQGVWMGWERKRGKLHEFNLLMRGARHTSFLMEEGYEQLQLPSGVRFVVTLDADTRLPRGTVRRLVGKMCHPLNRGCYDPARGYVVEGYGILQPRVSSSLPEQNTDTWFQRIFYNASGIDPYAFAISDVYQDLFEEGSFTGKGIYDIDVFEQAIAARIPENAVLSHDLLEGIFARAGLASDVEVVEEFPSRYDAACARQSRWARGDWQLLPWIFGRRSQDIPGIGYWKMVDNLRRSLTPPFTFLALVIGWTLPLHSILLWAVLVIAAYTMPLLLPLAENAMPRRGTPWGSHLRMVGADLRETGQRILWMVVFLPHQAWLMLEAILRTLWRVYVSRRHLLEWVTAADAKVRRRHSVLGYYAYMWGGVALTVLAVYVSVSVNPMVGLLALPFVLLWGAAPYFAWLSSRPIPISGFAELQTEDRKTFRLVGREIWHFFESFVTAADHWLPPDNFQEDPAPVIAHRTSPTNMGLYLLTAVAAADFGWIGTPELLERWKNTFATFAKMERYRGHFFNWYDTSDLRPLEPRYVSSVDSGNLAAYLLIVIQVCRATASRPLLASGILDGVDDALTLMAEAVAKIAIEKSPLRDMSSPLAAMKGEIARARSSPFTLEAASRILRALAQHTTPFADAALSLGAEKDGISEETVVNLRQWAEILRRTVGDHLKTLDMYAPWVALAEKDEGLRAALPSELSRLLFGPVPDFGRISGLCAEAALIIQREPAIPSRERLTSALLSAAHNARALIEQATLIAAEAQKYFEEMSFAFLFDPKRKLLSIGFRVNDHALDQGCYDLLASEARVSSIVAIAKGDIPDTNWFRLGRVMTEVEHRPLLISWSGSMFEYLMPALVMREPADSLLGVTNRMAVRRQIDYGEERGVPWGVSESAYSARDLEMTYQYLGFGVPGLGLKRGLSEDIVVAPYATALAAMFEPKAALANLRRMRQIGAHGDYGWFEAIDFTPKRLPAGEKMAVVRAYMAHHQGMSLVAVHNVLFDDLMRGRFHGHPIIQAAELMLQELPPRKATIVKPRFEEVDAIAHVQKIKPIPPRSFKSPHTATPQTQLLSNGHYAVMVTAAGGGYSQWRGLAVTRWHEDPTQDNWGSFIYMRDVESGEVFSAAHQPACVEAQEYSVIFHEDKAEFTRRDGDLVTTMNIVVSTEDQGEVRRLSLLNRGDSARDIELTSYMEIVLASPQADTAHPAFAKMFVETEFVAKPGALLATRRRRAPDETPIWAVHTISGGEEELQFETDRMLFIGRGRNLRDPAAMDGKPLGGNAGCVLDPIFSLRCRVRVAPGATAHIAFCTFTAASREEALVLAHKYRSPNAYHRVATLAWTQAQLQYQHLGITPAEANLFQRLANAVLYANPVLRPNPEALKKGAGPQSVLWSAGISGDLPIVLMRVDVVNDLKTLRQLVKAHTYWSMKRLEVDLVILNEQPTSYIEDLQGEIELMVRTSQALPRTYDQSVKGRIHVLRGDQVSPEARGVLHAVARAVIVGHRGSLSEQLAFVPRETVAVSLLRALTPLRSTPAPVPSPPLEFFNGIGGFAAGGREYVVRLENGQTTPLPWINVIANPAFGFHVSADGAGYTWAFNSRENKLTPWSNDPVMDGAGEAIYLRDLDRNVFWSPTASPVRKAEASYVARHGMGYSCFTTIIHDIETELTQYVPLDAPVKISRLKIRNRSFVARHLAVTSFTDWVLGPFRRPADLVVTEFDAAIGAMYARNPWAGAAGLRAAFVHISAGDVKCTGDRREFIGRNGSLASPAALVQRRALSGKTGAGLDPCSVLQGAVELKGGEEAEIVILLGQAEDEATARAIIAKYSGRRLEASFEEIKTYWNELLEQVQVETPDRSFDIMLNGWLLYQTVVCRLWARSAFYQSSGAYGYRDQLQDVMAVAAFRPHWTRHHLLRAAGRQFPEGDVQHWWLPSESDAGQGVRTRFADDALWLPFVTAYYMRVTGDDAVLDETVPFLLGPALGNDQRESFFLPEKSSETASLFEHCARAIDKSLAAGAHGLGLFGGGDWNDGMNRVGIKGQGESVWLSWFAITVIRDFLGHAENRDPERAAKWRERSEQFQQALEHSAWDGEWYRRGYYDDGTPLGAATGTECRIDSIAQSWAVISGAAQPERQRSAMLAVEKYLIRAEDRLALLFTPPFDHTPMDPGYIKGYPPGIRENGGQYTHAALWNIVAYALLGDGDKAHELFGMLNPISHAGERAQVDCYRVEPYAVAADIYSNPQHVGRGGWTWYTGSAGWMYRAGLEYILGFRLEGARLRLDPCIPKAWPGFTLTYTHKSSRYRIRVDNTSGQGRGVKEIRLDGTLTDAPFVSLADDGREHEVTVVLGQ